MQLERKREAVCRQGDEMNSIFKYSIYWVTHVQEKNRVIRCSSYLLDDDSPSSFNHRSSSSETNDSTDAELVLRV